MSMDSTSNAGCQGARPIGEAADTHGDVVSAPPAVIVSGMPRSGTSMMMQALVAGGLDALTDGRRQPDASNVRGYYELESVKRLPHREAEFLDHTAGKAVKVIHTLLPHWPSDRPGRLIFMLRDLREVLASQHAMLQRQGRPSVPISEQRLAAALGRQQARALQWIARQPHLAMLEVQHADVLSRPSHEMMRVAEFLDLDLDTHAMAAVVDPTLQHHKRQTDA